MDKSRDWQVIKNALSLLYPGIETSYYLPEQKASPELHADAPELTPEPHLEQEVLDLIRAVAPFSLKKPGVSLLADVAEPKFPEDVGKMLVFDPEGEHMYKWKSLEEIMQCQVQR